MKTFEYSILKLNENYTRETQIDQLTQVGEQGWELVSIVPQDGHMLCYFKRETDTVAEQAKEKLDDALGALKNMAGGLGQGLGNLSGMGGFSQQG